MYRIASFAAAAALIFGFAISAGPWISASSQSQPALGKIISDAILELEPVTDSGIAVAVIKDGRLYYSGGFGFRDRCASTKVDANTLFGIGSATKAFTSMAISLLAEQNPTLRLDVPVKQYLPDFAMKDSEATEKMTLELILSHRTGLPRHDALWYLGPFTRSQLVYRLRYLDPYPQAFGNVFVYNNMMYMVAGSLLEAVAGQTWAGQTWENFVKTRIFAPLDMRQTDLSIGDLSIRANYAKPYQLKTEMPLKDVENIGPAAEINSNVLEMTNWVLLFLNHGLASNGVRLITAADLERMYTPYVSVPDAPGTGYGLGWFVGKIHDKRLVFHQGDTDGYSTYVSFMPDDNLGVIVLTNQHATNFPDKVAARIYDHLLNRPALDRVHLPRGLAQVAPVHPAAPEPHEPTAPSARLSLTDYPGMYSDSGYGDITVSSIGNDYINYYNHNWTLHQRLDGTFYFDLHAFGTDFQPRVFFHKTDAGKVDSLGIRFEPTLKPIQFMKR
ncbi:MAG TPA: serine hydrolase [Xanthobacteraceae bacterium]